MSESLGGRWTVREASLMWDDAPKRIERSLIRPRLTRELV